ncbi:MAG: DPP IV N-terminal domain-containing protein [Gemmatimonadota bacterium]|nr:DPP IV N-terminal domain-containing protein [Gemmatimonadota bacterium]
MRNSMYAALTCIILCTAVGHTQEHLTRDEIYDRWDDLNLTKTTGIQSVSWLPDGQGYLETEVDSTTGIVTFYRVDARNGTRAPLFDRDQTSKIASEYNRLTGKAESEIPFKEFSHLPDYKGVRFKVEEEEFVYWSVAESMVKLPAPNFKLAGWTPHRSSGQLTRGTYTSDFRKVAYVKDYDIYVTDAATEEETQVTFGGTEDVMNGRTDWVYPEELRQSQAFWWSPSGSNIAYLQFDVRVEHTYPLLHEIDLETEEGFDHYRFKTLLEVQRYPKAGEPNPTVKLFIADVATGKTVEVDTDSSPDVYLIKMNWRNDGSELTFQRLNRFQNRLELLAADPATGSVRTIMVEEDEAFVRLHNNYIQLEDGEHFTWTSERSGWNHLYLYNYDGTLVKQLTDGPWEVSRVRHVDNANRLIYFATNTENGLESHFSRVKFDGTDLKQLTTESGNHTVNIDPVGRHYTDNYSSLTTPPVVNIVETNGRVVRNLSTTTLDMGRMEELGLELPELVTFRADDGVTVLHAILYKPAQFDPSKQYPLLVTVYGGPSSGVRNRFIVGYRDAQLGYFVIKQDNRGTTNRGKKYLAETYLKFGQVEIDDQAAGVHQITQRPYIDGNRVGIFGGSYGGYASSMALLRYPDLFHVGVAAAPVTDWRSYDTIYTERYMRTPQANPEGYDAGSAMTYASNLKGKLFLMHGLIDNNVHMGNTIHLSDALQKAGKMFDLMIYPENRHGVRGYHRTHMNRLRTLYFLKHLRPEGWEERMEKVERTANL